MASNNFGNKFRQEDNENKNMQKLEKILTEKRELIAKLKSSLINSSNNNNSKDDIEFLLKRF